MVPFTIWEKNNNIKKAFKIMKAIDEVGIWAADAVEDPREGVCSSGEDGFQNGQTG